LLVRNKTNSVQCDAGLRADRSVLSLSNSFVAIYAMARTPILVLHRASCVAWTISVSSRVLCCMDDSRVDSYIVEAMTQVNDSGDYCLRRSTEVTYGFVSTGSIMSKQFVSETPYM
jgi:hypothetical protein